MALQTEIWSRDIAANLFPDNTFLARAKDDSMFVENKVVHLPQSGSVPGVTRNRSSYPATIAQRTDTEATYNLVELTSDPTHITDIDAIEVSYDKRQNVLGDHIDQIRRKAADYILWQWAPTAASGNLILTSGAVRAASAPSATLTRKSLAKADLVALKLLFDKNEIPQDGRFLLLNAAMFSDVMADTSITSRDYTDNVSIEQGTIGSLFGFRVYLRSFVTRALTANSVAKDPDTAGAATDNAWSLAWHTDFVRRALGEVKVYSDIDKPEYYGSIFSAMARMGGSKSYSDFRGIAALAEN